MAMTTRCPQCGTTFKVVPDQLRVRNGLVRCGECATVFDGRACLIAQIPAGFERPLAVPGVAAESVGTVTLDEPPESRAPVSPSVIREPAEPTSPVIVNEPPERSVPVTPAVLRGRSDIAKRDPFLNERTAQDEDDEREDEDVDREPIEHFTTDSGTRDEVVFRIGGAKSVGDRAERIESSVYDDADMRADADPRDQESADHYVDSDFHEDEPTDRHASKGFRDDEDAESRLRDEDRDESDDQDSPVVLGESRTRYHGETDVGRAPPEFLDADHHARRSFMRSLWGYACVFGLLLLAAQFLFVYRSTIAGMAPELRPLLVRLCEPIGCEVGYVRHIDRISITSSSLQPPRGQAGAPQQDDLSKLVLRASVRNLYDQPQPWPALRLDLSDMSDTVVIRKILLPEDYLPKGQAQRPFEAGAEINIAVPIEVSGPHVTGFQLHKFFP